MEVHLPRTKGREELSVLLRRANRARKDKAEQQGGARSCRTLKATLRILNLKPQNVLGLGLTSTFCTVNDHTLCFRDTEWRVVGSKISRKDTKKLLQQYRRERNRLH